MPSPIPIEIAAACFPNGGMGRANRLPWDCKEDMRYFAKLTTGHVVIMGRNTWDSLKRRPLPKRINIVVSSTLQSSDMPTGVLLAPSLKDALELLSASADASDHRRVFIIGGARLFQEAMEHPACALAHVTEINESCAINRHDDCDIFFPLTHLHRFFELQTQDSETQTDGERERCIFRAYTRRRNNNLKN